MPHAWDDVKLIMKLTVFSREGLLNEVNSVFVLTLSLGVDSKKLC